MAKENKPLIIFLAGDLINENNVVKLINSRSFDFYAADGGYHLARKLDLPIRKILGDFDSSTKPCEGNIFVFPSEKDETDSELALNMAVEEGYKEIWMIAPFGGRMDHTYANLCLLEKAKKNGVNLFLYDGFNLAFMLSNEVYLFDGFYRYVSFFSWSETVVLTLEGFKYPLNKYTLKRFLPLGISNELVSDCATATVEHGNIICICIEKEVSEDV